MAADRIIEVSTDDAGTETATDWLPAPLTAQANGTKVHRPRCRVCFDEDSGEVMNPTEKQRFLDRHSPNPGDLWRCPLCQRYSIAHVNVKIVVGHDHNIGRPRALICDSCNTGLGRFRNGDDYLRSRARLFVKIKRG